MRSNGWSDADTDSVRLDPPTLSGAERPTRFPRVDRGLPNAIRKDNPVTYQIIYSSEAATPMQTDDLEKLLCHARRRNADEGITGALVYAEGIFLQILEGDKVRVQDLMATIRRDMRHVSVLVLREGEIPAKIFGNWKMAYVGATPQQVAEWAGLGAANNTAESFTETVEEQNRTAQFARDILSLLVADDTTKGKAE